MAQEGFTPIQLYHTTTAASVPVAASLLIGELAVNVTDKRVFTRNASNAVVELGTSPSTIKVIAGSIDGTPIGATAPSTGAFTFIEGDGSGITALNADNLATGTVPIALMGTAGGTASAATYLRGDNTWASPTSLPAGSTSEVQYNEGGVFAASSAFTFDGTSLLRISADATPSMVVNATAALSFALFATQVNGLNRWTFGKSNVAESGSATGSTFVIRRHDDAGNFIDDAVSIARNTAAITVTGDVMASTATQSLVFNNLTAQAPASNLTFMTNGSFVWKQTVAGGNAEWMRVTSSGQLLTGAQTPETFYTGPTAFISRVQNSGSTAASASTSVSRYSNDNGGPLIVLGKSRNSTVLAHTIVQANDLLGHLSWNGSDGVQMKEAARIYAFVGGAPALNSVPGGIIFSTNPVGANAIVERMRIGSNGNVGIGAVNTVDQTLRVSKDMTGATSVFGVVSSGVVQSDATLVAAGFQSNISTAPSFTLGSLYHYQASQGTIGSGGFILNQFGFIASSNMIGATSNYGFFGNIPAGANRYNLYMAGTADNYMLGNLGLGIAPLSTDALVVSRPAGTHTFIRLNVASVANLQMGFNDTAVTLNGVTTKTAYLGMVQAFDMVFVTNAIERMRISGTGNVNVPGTLSVAGVNVAPADYVLKVGSVMTGHLTLNADPTQALHAASKQYVDNVAAGLAIKESVVTGTTVPLATSSAGTITYANGTAGVGATLTTTGNFNTIGGAAVVDGNRVLVKDEVNAAHNGIYVRTSATVLTRATDFDNSPATEIDSGDYTFVSAGTLGGSNWAVMTAAPITLGTTPITFTQLSGASQYTAGPGISIADNIISNTGVLSVAPTALQTTVSTTAGVATVGLTPSVTISGTMNASAFVGAGTNLTGTANALSIGGNAATATKLATVRTFSASGDVTALAQNFDGTANVDLPMLLPTVNATVGVFGTSTAVAEVTVNAKGLVTKVAAIPIAFPVTSVAGRTGDVVLSASDITGYGAVNDATFQIVDDLDPTKIAKFQVSAIATGTTQVYTLPNISSQIAVLSGISQSFSTTVTFSGGTVTVGTFTGAGTYGLGTGATTTGLTKTINIGTAGLAGSTTTINIGSSLGTGTITINQPVTAGTITATLVGNASTATSLAGGTAGALLYQSAVGVSAFLAAGTVNQVLVGGAAAPSWTNTPTLTGTNFTGIPNSALTNSSITVGTTPISLGGSATALAGLTSVTSAVFVGPLTGNATTATTATNVAGGTIGSLLYQSAADTTAMLADIVVGNALLSGGVNTAPLWGKIGLTTHVSGTLPAASGGTGQTLYVIGDMLYASTTTALSKLAGVIVGNALISGGVGAAPSWGKIGLATHVSGSLPPANGGTGLTGLGTANQIVGVNAAATAIEYKTLTAGTGISITPAAGSLTIATSDMVTLTTAQTITGDKTLTGITTISDLRYSGTNIMTVNGSNLPFVGGYFDAGDMIEILTITPPGPSLNYEVIGEIYVQSGAAVQIHNIQIALRSNTLPDLVWTSAYSEQRLGTTANMAKPVMWINELAGGGVFKLALQNMGVQVHNYSYTLKVIFRSGVGYNDVTVNRTPNSDVTAVPANFTSYDLTNTLILSDDDYTVPSTFNVTELSIDNIGNLNTATLVTSTTAANQIVDSFSSTVYRSAKYQVQVTAGTAYQMCELHVLHDGTTVFMTEYGNLLTGVVLATFDANILTGVCRLLVTPVNAVTTIKVLRTLITL